MNMNESGKTPPKFNRTPFMLGLALMTLLLVLIVLLSERVPARGAPNLSDGSSITLPPDWDIIFQDSFDDNEYDWPVGVSDDQWVRNSWQFKNGVYRWEAEAMEYVYWYVRPNHGPLDDFYLGIDVRKVSGAEDAIYGVVYRIEDNNNLYFLQIYDPGQFALWRKVRGEWFALIKWRQTETIRSGQVNRIEVMAEGPEFSIAINGQKVGTASDDRLEVGGIGIAIQLLEEGDRAVFEFDNLVIRAPLKPLTAAEWSSGDLEKRIEELLNELEAYRQAGDEANVGKTLNNLGNNYYFLGDYETAIDTLQQAVSIFESIGLDWRTAYSLDGLGMVYLSMGENQKSKDYYERAIEIVQREIDNKEWEASILHNLGLICEDLGDYTLAIDYLEQSLKLWRGIGNIQQQAWVLHGIGWNYHKSGDDEQGIVFLERAMDQFNLISDLYGEARLLISMGRVYQGMGNYDKALNALQNAVRVQRKMNDRSWQANTLYDIADLCVQFNDHEQALNQFDQALEIQRNLGPAEGELTDKHYIGRRLIDRYNISNDSDDLKQAASYLEEALEVFRDAGDQMEQAVIFQNLGSVYENLSDFAKAVDYTRQSLELWRSLGDRTEEAWALNRLGYYLSFLFDYIEAMEALEQARQLFQDTGDLNGEGWVLGNMAFVTSNHLGYDDGMEYQLEALDVYQELGDLGSLAECLNALGRYSTNIGDYEAAMGYFQEAADTWHQLGDRVNEPRAVNNIGVVYAYLGDRDRAVEYYQEALEMNIAIGHRWGEATMLSNLGENYLIQDEPETALDYCQQGKAIFEEINLREGLYQATNLSCLGRAYQEMGDTGQAETYILESYEMMKDEGDPYGLSLVMTDLGEFYYEAGKYDQALEVLDEVLQLWRKNGDPEGESRTLKLIGKVYEALGEADSALDAYLESIRLTESIIGRVKAESFQAAMAAKEVDVYQLAVELLNEMARYAEAFQLSERSRARNFLEAMGNRRPDIRESGNRQLVQQEEDLRSRISALETGLFNEKSKPDDQQNTDLIADLQGQLTRTQQDYADLIAEMQMNNPELASLVAVNALTVDGVQDLLDGGTTLVAYYLTGSHPLAFVISKDAFHAVTLPEDASSITAAVENFQALGLANLGNPKPRSLEDLYTWLIAPLQPYLNTARIGIIPHQALHYIPFAALYDGQRYFSEQYTLFQLPSSSSLPFIQQKTGHERSNPLVMGDPDTQNPDLPSLDYAAKEAERIATLYTAQPLLGSQASESALRESSPRNGIIHIAAHGGLNPQAPMFSRLWLAPGEGDDGQLNVYEVYGLDLTQTDLVVLSACQTQHGEVSAGDEIISLNRAFLYGSPTVISSLWSVDDQATGELMEHFYTYLRDGMTKAQALQTAQDEIRNDPDHPEWQHPYYWAAFVLNGDPGEPDEAVLDTNKIIPPPMSQQPESSDEQKNNLPLIILVGGGALVLITFLGLVIKRSNRKKS